MTYIILLEESKMIIGIGTDIIEIERIAQAIRRTPRFIEKVYTLNEMRYYEDKKKHIETLAGLFAGKEAVSKALGTGFRGFSFIDIEIVPNEMGKPGVTLYRSAQKLAESLSITSMHISISHCKNYATACVIAESEEKDGIINK